MEMPGSTDAETYPSNGGHEQDFVVDISKKIASLTTNTKYSAYGFSDSRREIKSRVLRQIY